MEHELIGNFARLFIYQDTTLGTEPFVINVSHRATPTAAETNVARGFLFSSVYEMRDFLTVVGANGLFGPTKGIPIERGYFETIPCTIDQFMCLLAENNNCLPQSITLIALNTLEEEIKDRLSQWSKRE